MIPENFIEQWRQHVKWQIPAQVEQDLIINRALTDLYNDPHISEALVFRSGTALNKLFLKPPSRYSEDIDFVQKNADSIGQTIDAIRAILKPCIKAFAKHAVAEVIADDTNMIIMQRAVPGITLKDHFPDNDIDATKILCASIKELYKVSIPENHNFYHLSELFKTLDQTLDIPNEILTKAKYLRDKLLSTTTEEVLLHGDLHHDNILLNNRHPEFISGPDKTQKIPQQVRDDRSEDGWLIIDLKGFIGDPACESERQ